MGDVESGEGAWAACWSFGGYLGEFGVGGKEDTWVEQMGGMYSMEVGYEDKQEMVVTGSARDQKHSEALWSLIQVISAGIHSTGHISIII